MEENEKFEIELNDIWKVIILIAVGMILSAGYIIYSEYSSARKCCLNNEGVFSFEFPSEYFCNGKPLLKYSNGWDFKREVVIDFSNPLIFP